MSIALISHSDCVLHDMGMDHPESPYRIQVINDALLNSDLKKYLTLYESPLATQEQLLRVHDKEYVNFIFSKAPKEGLIPLDPDTWMNPYTLNAALHAAGAAVLGVDLVMKGEEAAAFCNVRPPGHHAEKAKAMGFCFFNNVAVGVAHALACYNLKRIAIIDFDVHHGNGTENIFQHDERVLLCSSFQSPFYPFSGTDTQSNHLVNVPLSSGTNGLLFRKEVEKAWFEKIYQFNPELIFFSAGFDGYLKDNMANLLLNEDDYFWITQQIKMIADKTCKGRIVSVLEGGYHLPGLAKCVEAHLRALLA